MAAEGTVNQILEAFGKSINLSDVRLNKDKTCVLCVDEDKNVQVTYNEAREALDFFAPVGQVAENEKRCCNYLLKSNSEWTLTKGTALAKGNGSSEVILEYRLPLLNLTKEPFERAFEQFIGLVTVWRMYLLELEQGNVPKVFAVFQKN
jgi:hypothetical protein